MASARAGMRCSNFEAIFATVHLVLTQGIFLTNYVLDQGGSNLVCGIIEALPYTVQFTYFLSPLLVRRMRRRKPVVLGFAIAHRASWGFLILLLYTGWSSTTREMLMVLVLLLANVCAVLPATRGTPGWPTSCRRPSAANTTAAATPTWARPT